MIGSKQFEVTVNLLNVEHFREGKDGRLNIVYLVPNNEGGVSKRNETYDCFELNTMIETFNSIVRNIETTYRTMSMKVDSK